jgi:pimeloyl-ACP methyl ester carboxylesterase
MTTTDTPVLFLSGAGLPAWIWDDLRADLTQASDTAVARYPRGPGACLADYADVAAAQAPWPTFAVVAHSIGGVVATELLARHSGRVAGVLGVAAFIPPPGRSFVHTTPFPNRLILPAVLRLAGTRPPAKAIRSGLAAGLPMPTVDRIVADFDPEPVRLYHDATSPRQLPAVTAYLHTSEDKEITAATQRRSAEALHAAWTQEIPTGHLPMLQDPTRTNQAIRRLLAAIDH